MAYAQDSHDLVVFHNKNKNKKIKFKFDSQLFLDNNAPLKPFVSDFNGDGLEDIALLSTQSDGHSFLALAGKKGKFKKSEFENITPYFEGVDFSTDNFSLHLWSDEDSEQRQILRLANSEHGVDEQGAPLNYAGEPAARNITENSYSAYDVEEGECPHHAYSPMNKRVIQTCGFESQRDDLEANNTVAGLLQLSSLQADSLQTDSPQTSISKSAEGNPSSATALSSPAPAEAAVTFDDTITISWEEVTGATYFNREVSLNGEDYQNSKTYPADQTSVIFYNQQVRSYRYRVRACNSGGCSPWAYTGTVTVYAVIVPPATPYAVPSIVGGNYQPVNATFAATVTPVSGATYYNIHVGYSPSYTPHVNGSASTYHPNLQTGGSYGYRYVRYAACNTSGCSGLSPYQRIYVYTAPGQPNGFSSNTSSVTTATSATLSWSQAGGTIPTGYYKLEELKPGQSWVHIASITAGYGASFSSNVAPYNVPGTYSYRLRACSPDRGCGSTTSVAITLHNRNPIADNESATVDEGAAISINVLAGDADPDNHGVSISGYTQPSRGNVSCSGSQCTFSANVSISANYNDSFTYTITDGYGGYSTASVSISIINHNQTVVTPSISPAGHTFNTPQTVSITTSTSGATIYYTTDGTHPTTSSLPYTGPLTVSYDKVVRALAIKSGYVNSAVNTQTFTRNRAVPMVVSYQYDALGRLVKVIEPVNGDRDYDYDPAGNRQSVSEDSQ